MRISLGDIAMAIIGLALIVGSVATFMANRSIVAGFTVVLGTSVGVRIIVGAFKKNP